MYSLSITFALHILPGGEVFYHHATIEPNVTYKGNDSQVLIDRLQACLVFFSIPIPPRVSFSSKFPHTGGEMH